MEVKNINNFPRPENLLFCESLENGEKVKIWAVYKEALSGLLEAKIINNREFYYMTIGIRKSLGLLVIQ